MRRKKNSGASELATRTGSNGKASSSSQKQVVGADYTNGNGTVTRSVKVEILVSEVTNPVTVVTEKDVSLVEEARNNWKSLPRVDFQIKV